jgi:hypothetical protein
LTIGATQLVVQDALEIVVPLRVVVAVVDPEHDRQVDAFARRRDQDLPGAALQVQRRAVPGAELAGGLDHDVGAEPAPVDRGRVPLGQHRDRGATDDQRVRRVLHGTAEPSVGRVERQQVRQRARVGDVVDRHHLQVRPLQRQAREGAPDPAEAMMPTLIVMLLPPHGSSRQPARPAASASSPNGHLGGTNGPRR